MTDTRFLSIITKFTQLVDGGGYPSDFLMRYLQERGGGLTNLDAIAAALQAAEIKSADASVVVTNGVLGDGTDPDLSVDEQVVLDAVGTTRGSILYRGASGWALLTPGTSGNFLKTNGAGADPSWGAAGGGGGVAWNDLTFSSSAGTPSWLSASWYESNETISAPSAGDVIEIEAMFTRPTAADICAFCIALSGATGFLVVRQTDDNYVLYYTTSASSATVLEGGSFNINDVYYQRLYMRIYVGDGTYKHIVCSEDHFKNRKMQPVSNSTVGISGTTSKLWYAAASASDLVWARYRILPAGQE